MKLNYDWKNAPAWARYAARDFNGFARWYEDVPTPHFEFKSFVEWSKTKLSLEADCDPFWNQRMEIPEAHLSLEARPTNEQLEYSKNIYIQLSKLLESYGITPSSRTYKLEQDYINALDGLYRLKHNLPLDPLVSLVGKTILVVKPEGIPNVSVLILRNKIDDTYSFVNTTKLHICTCKFSTVLEAILDLESQVDQGKVLSWKILPELD